MFRCRKMVVSLNFHSDCSAVDSMYLYRISYIHITQIDSFLNLNIARNHLEYSLLNNWIKSSRMAYIFFTCTSIRQWYYGTAICLTIFKQDFDSWKRYYELLNFVFFHAYSGKMVRFSRYVAIKFLYTATYYLCELFQHSWNWFVFHWRKTAEKLYSVVWNTLTYEYVDSYIKCILIYPKQ